MIAATMAAGAAATSATDGESGDRPVCSRRSQTAAASPVMSDIAEAAEPLWTYRDLSDYARIPLASLRMMVCRGRLPHLRVGPRTVRFQPSAVRAWLAARAAGGRP